MSSFQFSNPAPTNSLTVEISLYIIKYNVNAFLLKNNVTNDLKYYWIKKKWWGLKKIIYKKLISNFVEIIAYYKDYIM